MTQEMPGNPHAELMESYADPRNSLEASAILALAFEQRTANLIALWNTGDDQVGMAGMDPEDYARVAHQIKERLGL